MGAISRSGRRSACRVRTEAWQAELAANYRSCEVASAVSADFRADVRHRTFGPIRVVECMCDPCSGRRSPSHVNVDAETYIGVQITKSGGERFTLGDESFAVGGSDLVIWTSAQPIKFTVTNRLHKVSLILPWTEVRERLPTGVPFKGTIIDSENGIGAVLFSHIDSLSRQLRHLDENDSAAVQRSTLELLVAAMSYRTSSPPQRLAERYLVRLQDYILATLHDENMSPATIASANRISVRYVHTLFA